MAAGEPQSSAANRFCEGYVFRWLEMRVTMQPARRPDPSPLITASPKPAMKPALSFFSLLLLLWANPAYA